MTSVIVAAALAPSGGEVQDGWWWSWLDPVEQAQACRFRFPADRAAYGASHGLRRWLVARTLNVDPARITWTRPEAQGKPCLSGDLSGWCDVSLSHTRGAVACVVGQGAQVGIDIEPQARVIASAMHSEFLTPHELELAKTEAAFSPVQRWTLKEAVSKAVGLGVVLDFSTLALQRCTSVTEDLTSLSGQPMVGAQSWTLAASEALHPALHSDHLKHWTVKAWEPFSAFRAAVAVHWGGAGIDSSAPPVSVAMMAPPEPPGAAMTKGGPSRDDPPPDIEIFALHP